MYLRALIGTFPFLLLSGCGAGSGTPGPDDGTGNSTSGDGDGDGPGSGGGGGQGSGGVNPGSGGSGVPECNNVRPTGTSWDEATCDEWATETGECTEDWMINGNYCNESCGRCDPGGGGSGNGDPVVTGGPDFVGNITTGDQVNPQGRDFATHWDQITPENAGKWGSVQFSPGAGYNWGTLDAIYDYANDRGILFKQHAFVWGEQQPGGVPNEQQVRDWMRSFCDRYPNTQLIDVVNEPPPHTYPNYADSIGGGTDGNWQWITNSFTWAREACPRAILILNDYNNIEWNGDASHFIDIVNTVLENGGPIDAIGAQSHDLDDSRVNRETVEVLLERLHAETKLPIYISELDLSYADDQQQLAKYQEYFPLFMEAEYVKGITIWGWIYGATWSKAPDSGLVRNGQNRPAMNYLMEYLGRAAN